MMQVVHLAPRPARPWGREEGKKGGGQVGRKARKQWQRRKEGKVVRRE